MSAHANAYKVKCIPMDATSIRYAGFSIRFLANLIDGIILTVASWLVSLMILGALYWILGWSGGLSSVNQFFVQLLELSAYILLAFLYYTYGHFRYGTTLGKAPLRVYVTQAETFSPLTLKQSVIRSLAYTLSYLPFGCGFLMVAFHPEKRALHDLIARTVSTRRAKKGAEISS